MESYKLVDNRDSKRYEFHIGDDVALIEYIKTRNGKIYLTHTETPKGLEGKGIASALVKAVLADIDVQGFRLVPLCPFVVSYIQKHPEWRRLVIQ